MQQLVKGLEVALVGYRWARTTWEGDESYVCTILVREKLGFTHDKRLATISSKHNKNSTTANAEAKMSMPWIPKISYRPFQRLVPSTNSY